MDNNNSPTSIDSSAASSLGPSPTLEKATTSLLEVEENSVPATAAPTATPPTPAPALDTTIEAEVKPTTTVEETPKSTTSTNEKPTIEVDPELKNWAASQGLELESEQEVKLAKIARDNQVSSRDNASKASSAEKQLLEALSPNTETSQTPQVASPAPQAQINQQVQAQPNNKVESLEKKLEVITFLQKYPEARKVAASGALDEHASRLGDLEDAWKIYQFERGQKGIKKEVEVAKQEERERLSKLSQAQSTSASAQGVTTPGAATSTTLDQLNQLTPGTPEHGRLSAQYARELMSN